MKRTCVQCGKKFEITADEAEFFRSKGLSLPKRCKTCRDKNSGKYTVSYAKPKPLNYALAIIFLVIGVAVAYFDFAAGVFTGTFANVLIGISIAAFITFFLTRKKRTVIDVSFSNKYTYRFYDAKSFVNHFYKHRYDVDCKDLETYLRNANRVISDKNSIHKTASSGDVIYYNLNTGDYVVLSRAGYIRSYYRTNYKHYLKQ